MRQISTLLQGFQKEEGTNGIRIYKTKGWDYAGLNKTYEEAIARCREEHVPCLIHVEEITQPQGHSTSGSHERYKSTVSDWIRDKDGKALLSWRVAILPFVEQEALYRQFLASKPSEQALVALAQEDIGLCAEARGELDAALVAFQAQQIGSFYRERSLWNQARIYAKKNDKKKAIEIYKDLLSKAAPQSALRDDVANRLAALEQ